MLNSQIAFDIPCHSIISNFPRLSAQVLPLAFSSDLHLLTEVLPWFANHHVHSNLLVAASKVDLLPQIKSHLLIDLEIDLM